jgi:hypothetical protein
VSTYSELQSRIADDIVRTDLTTQIAQNILLAIKHYKERAAVVQRDEHDADRDVEPALHHRAHGHPAH